MKGGKSQVPIEPLVGEEREKRPVLLRTNPLADFIRKYMRSVNTLTEDDAWQFVLACFEWVQSYGYAFRVEKTAVGYKLTVAKQDLKRAVTP